MARAYTPWDVSVQNHLLPLLQARAMEDWNRAIAPTAPEATPVQPPIEMLRRAAAPAGAPSAMAPRRAPAASPVSPADPPPIPRSSPAAAPAAAQGGLAGILNGMSPEERSMMLASQLGGAAQGLLSAGPGASIGRMLLGAGAGALGGHAQGLQGIRLGQQQDARSRLLERQIAGQEAELDQQQRQRQAVQAMLDDPSVPQTQKNLIKLSMAGVPAGAITAMTPQTMTPYQQESLRLKEQEIAARAARGGGAKSEPLVPVFDPESGRTTYAPRSQAVGMAVPPKATSSGSQYGHYRVVGGKLVDLRDPSKPVYDPGTEGGDRQKAWLRVYDAERRAFRPEDKARSTADEIVNQLFGGGAPAAAPDEPQDVSLSPTAEAATSGASVTMPMPPATTPPSVGTIEEGYRFKGGDPANPDSWEPVG
jgi:hypothetical protein